MKFGELLVRAKSGDTNAKSEILYMYRPLLLKESVNEGIFDEDLFQELNMTLLVCINKFLI